MAKDISMMERGKEGSKVRKYFRDCEKIAKKAYHTELENAKRHKKIITKKPPLTITERAEQLGYSINPLLIADMEDIAKDLFYIKYYHRKEL